ncbi:MAG: DegT/DnrJ/EryC1/StrS family aminotransferase [Candidatus Omnitrophica bacterium]|nr:DegT/DnrJ/EryC1/StrS family aminotransferase [Candidatus Omnitrophota bacterium]
MNIFKEIPPTAGWSISIKSLILPLIKKCPARGLEEEFKKYLGAPAALLTYSGTAAFYLILESLKKISGKTTVIIPAFVCPLIPLAIKRAGLKIKLCDINQNDFDFNPGLLRKICAEDKDILAILAVHLGGIPAELETISEIAKKDNIFLIEDCAQSLGAEYQDKKTGSFGEFAFFSLCRGKGLTIYEGGLAITNKPEYSWLLDTYARKAIPRSRLSETLKILELPAYSLFYRPQLFWFAFRLPQIFWQMLKNPVKAMGEYFDIDFPIHKVSGFRESLGYLFFNQLDENIQQQRQKTADYLAALGGIPGIKPLVESARTKASYPYLTLVFEDAGKRNRALKLFQNSGLGISQIYLAAITDYPYLKNIVPDTDCPHARSLAERTITLSTSKFLKETDLKNIIHQLKKL